MKCFITGVAGFIGSNLAERLLGEGNEVVGFDNYSTGKAEFLRNASQYNKFTLYMGDLLYDKDSLPNMLYGSDYVFHFAANADVKNGLSNPTVDVEQNIIATHNVLEAMRKASVKKIVFPSTGSIYGTTDIFPTSERTRLEYQTSLYSASKLAAEALIQAYCEGFGFTSFIFRFVSILGKHYHHGHVYDFYKQLKEHPYKLKVLGNGYQRKSYLHIDDCIDGILKAIYIPTEKVNTYNLGTPDTVDVRGSINIITDYMKCKPAIEYGTDKQGWVGDNTVYLDIAKMRKLSWEPKYNITESILATLKYFKESGI